MNINFLKTLHPGGLVVPSSIFSAHVAFKFLSKLKSPLTLDNVLELAKYTAMDDPEYPFHSVDQKDGWRRTAERFPRLSRAIPMKQHAMVIGGADLDAKIQHVRDTCSVLIYADDFSALKEKYGDEIGENPLSVEDYAKASTDLPPREPDWDDIIRESPYNSLFFADYDAFSSELELQNLLEQPDSVEKAIDVHRFFIEKKPLYHANGRVGRFLFYRIIVDAGLLTPNEYPTYPVDVTYRNPGFESTQSTFNETILKFIQHYKRCTILDIFHLMEELGMPRKGDLVLEPLPVPPPKTEEPLPGPEASLPGPEEPLPKPEKPVSDQTIGVSDLSIDLSDLRISEPPSATAMQSIYWDNVSPQVLEVFKYLADKGVIFSPTCREEYTITGNNPHCADIWTPVVCTCE
jgi:hypothetical protein